MTIIVVGLRIVAGVALVAAMPAGAARPVGAKPADNPGTWVTPNDYPALALRQALSGKTGFRLDIDRNGRVTACSITVSSGAASLDQAACAALMARAAFTPARDRKGNAVPTTFTSSVLWQIPAGAVPQPGTIRCDARPDGAIGVETPFGCLR